MRMREESAGLVPIAAGTLMALAVTLGTGPAAHTWPPAQPGYVWSFPQDHWARDRYKTEGW